MFINLDLKGLKIDKIIGKIEKNVIIIDKIIVKKFKK